MDSLKSYIKHILPSAHFGRKSSGRWKKEESQGGKGARGDGREGREGRDGREKPVRSVSTPHVDQEFHGQPPTCSSPHLPPSSSAKELSAHQSQDGGCQQAPPRQVHSLPDAECTRTPPPCKPPRKDRVFCVELQLEGGGDDLGLDVEVVPLGAALGGRQVAEMAGPQGSGAQGSGVGMPSSPPTTPQQGCSSLPPCVPLCAVKVVGVRERSAADREGRVKVKDEVVEVNGKTLLRESQESVNDEEYRRGRKEEMHKALRERCSRRASEKSLIKPTQPLH